MIKTAPMNSSVDLLIIGAGPAGLMAAAWASKYGISTRILDNKPSRVETGRADGLTCRTMEILDSFGVADTILRECSQDLYMKSWESNADDQLERKGTVRSQPPGVSRFHQSTLNQGRIEHLFLDLLSSQNTIKVERNVKTLELQLETRIQNTENTPEYPVSVWIHHPFGQSSSPIKGSPVTDDNSPISHECGSLETIRAKYVIGCDGAHSWTRRQLGIAMEGDTSDAVWGVLDIVPLTDFPDIRHTCAVYNKSRGGLHIVPREGRVVRFYIELTEAAVLNGRLDKASVTQEELLQTARSIMEPYKLDYRICDWWSIYQVGQRISNKFHLNHRVFLAGDAIHTHSPKVGQGMNVAFQDAYNLGWKLCSVIAGIAHPRILETYETERRQVALDLLDVDRKTNEYYSTHQKAGTAQTSETQRANLQSFRNEMYAFLSGVHVEYKPSLLVDTVPPTTAPLAKHIGVGKRMLSFAVVNHASGRSVELASLLPSTGHWRVLVFPGNLTDSARMQQLEELGRSLATLQKSLQSRFNFERDFRLLQIFTFIHGSRDQTPLLSLPEIFHPWHPVNGWDYDSVFVDEESNNVTDVPQKGVYGNLGIDPNIGCVVVCRPDQHVGLVAPVGDVGRLEQFICSTCSLPAARNA